jgi:hypothetical protein
MLGQRRQCFQRRAPWPLASAQRKNHGGGGEVQTNYRGDLNAKAVTRRELTASYIRSIPATYLEKRVRRNGKPLVSKAAALAISGPNFSSMFTVGTGCASRLRQTRISAKPARRQNRIEPEMLQPARPECGDVSGRRQERDGLPTLSSGLPWRHYSGGRSSFKSFFTPSRNFWHLR